MKVKTALKQSIVGAWVTAVLVLGTIGLFVAIPNVTTGMFLAFTGLFLAGEVINVIRIRRRAAKDPACLDEKID